MIDEQRTFWASYWAWVRCWKQPLDVYKPFVGGLGKTFEYAPETTPEEADD